MAVGPALIVNLPEEFVEVPLEVPFTVTLAPDSGKLFSPVTVPEMVVSAFWAMALSEKKKMKTVISCRIRPRFLIIVQRVI